MRNIYLDLESNQYLTEANINHALQMVCTLEDHLNLFDLNADQQTYAITQSIQALLMLARDSAKENSEQIQTLLDSTSKAA